MPDNLEVFIRNRINVRTYITTKRNTTIPVLKLIFDLIKLEGVSITRLLSRLPGVDVAVLYLLFEQ